MLNEAKADALFARIAAVVAGEQPPATATPSENLRFAMVTLRRPSGALRVASGTGVGIEAAVEAAARQTLVGASNPDELSPLRLDVLSVLESEEPFSPSAKLTLGDELGLVGLFLPEESLWVMPDEILAHKFFSESDGSIDAPELVAYLRATRPGAAKINPTTARRVRFDSYLTRSGRAVALYRGNPPPPEPTPPALLDAATRAGHYLLRHQRPDGSFHYLYQPWRDEVGGVYNVLRHAGTCFALYDLARATGVTAFQEAADRGLAWLFEKHSVPRNKGAELAIVDQDEAKLGGAALALLATAEAPNVREQPERLERARKLARYILAQQEPSGRFIAKTTWSTQDPDDFESAYYPGEAIFALMRLYAIDPNPDWLAAAERGAEFLIKVRDANKADAELDHDHWLLMGLDELHRNTGRALYVSHGTRIGNAIIQAMNTGPYPDWAGSYYQPPRATPASTRAEGLVALIRMLDRASAPTEPFRAALKKVTSFVLRCQITEENSLYYLNPGAALGGIRKSLTSNAVRIDFVQHAISAFLGLRELSAK